MEGKSWYEMLRRRMGLPVGEEEAVNAEPEWYRSYLAAASVSIDPLTPVTELSIVVLDAETTGLDVRQDHLLSLGALRIQGNTIKLTEQFEAYVADATEGTDWQGAVPIHGILPNSRRYVHSSEEEVIERLLSFLGGAVIIGHHIGFDREMINRALTAAGAAPLVNPVIDTAWLAQRIQPKGYWSPPGDYSLDSLARRYRIPLSDRHTALGDCYITGVLWLKLLSRFEEKLGRPIVLKDLEP